MTPGQTVERKINDMTIVRSIYYKDNGSHDTLDFNPPQKQNKKHFQSVRVPL